MSGSSVKETRRQTRRAMGADAIQIIQQLQKDVLSLAAVVKMAHDRIDKLELRLTTKPASATTLQ